MARLSLKPGGHIAILSHSQNGLTHHHHLFGRFGASCGGSGWQPSRRFAAGEARRVVFCSPCATKSDRDDYPGEGVYFCKTWSETRAVLEEGRSGPATVAVYPYAPIQTMA